MMQDDGEQFGRFKVRGLMRELKLISKQSVACLQTSDGRTA